MSGRPISTLKKQEVMDELDSYEVIYHEKDLLPSLKEQLKAARQAKGLVQTKVENPSTSISTLTRSQLLERCMEVDLDVPQTATKGTLCTMLKEHYMILEPLQWGEKLGFSRHRHLTMGQIVKDEPGFIDWAKENCTPTSHWGLKRFVKWIDALEEPSAPHMAPPVPGNSSASGSNGSGLYKTPMAKVQAKAQARTTVKREVPEESPTMTVDAQERVPTDGSTAQILAALNALSQKLTNLENQTTTNAQQIAAMQATEAWDDSLEDQGFRTGSETRDPFR